MIYGYCRISTAKQKIERQITNISKAYPAAQIIAEVYTGTKSTRPKWQELLKHAKAGDTLVFDSVSRMSRNADEGFKTYMELYNKGIELVFLKEATINTEAFKTVLGNEQLDVTVTTNDEDTDELVNGIMHHVAVYITKLAEKQIKLAFEQAQKEVDDLHQRTAEGIREAREQRGKQIGRPAGQKITTKKELQAREIIKKYNKRFGGSLNDAETIKMIVGTLGKCSRNSFYKYKKAAEAADS